MVDYRVGNIIEQEMSAGHRLVEVTERHAANEPGWDIDTPGFDGVEVSEVGDEYVRCHAHWGGPGPRHCAVAVWGYDWQVVRVVDEGCPNGRCSFRSSLHNDGECPPPQDLDDYRQDR